MPAAVRIERPSAPSLDAGSGRVQAVVDKVVYEGKARVTTTGGPVTYQLGEEPQYFSQAQVSIPLVSEGEPTLPQVNDTLTVLAHHDALMIGRQFRVVDVEAAGQFQAVRRMQVVGVQRWEAWTPQEDIPQEWRV